MSQIPFDNSIIDNAKNFEELVYKARTMDIGGAMYVIDKFGQNPDIDTGTSPEDIWVAGGTMTFLTAAETMDVASDSAQDAVAGTGAAGLTIFGLDNEYNLISESIVLTGLTPVTTVNSYIRVYRAVTTDPGSGETNAGNISITASTAATTQAYVGLGIGITEQTHWTVPAGYTAFRLYGLVSVFRSDGTGERFGEVAEMVKEFGGTIKETSRVGLRSATVEITMPTAPKFEEKTDIWARAWAAANNTTVSVTSSYLVIKNEYL